MLPKKGCDLLSLQKREFIKHAFTKSYRDSHIFSERLYFLVFPSDDSRVYITQIKNEALGKIMEQVHEFKNEALANHALMTPI